jgi:hypothetical protein
MAKVHAAKTLEQMLDVTSERTGIGRQIEQKRQPGLSIVLIQKDGGQLVAYEPPKPPLIEATPESAVVPVLSDSEDRT